MAHIVHALVVLASLAAAFGLGRVHSLKGAQAKAKIDIATFKADAAAVVTEAKKL